MFLYRPNSDGLFDETSPSPNRYSEYKDNESEEYTSVEHTSTTRTEKRTRKTRSKKLNLGAASNFGKDDSVVSDTFNTN